MVGKRTEYFSLFIHTQTKSHQAPYNGEQNKVLNTCKWNVTQPKEVDAQDPDSEGNLSEVIILRKRNKLLESWIPFAKKKNIFCFNFSFEASRHI